ncbi:TVP38/TMEM64 family protein [Legionella sp. W05-934-2]|jgi:uncharacterized membrane protein YdjX (TVP38/TMEM64 family)|uniref:TVP38/TMEM64 family protein n=1 Tax=Legionella sp. W05-934-2 TaxID=1198649 RepID=UPI0034633B10
MKFFFTLFFVLVFVGFTLLFNQHANDILIWIKSLGWAAPVFFCFFYMLATLFFMPTLVITFAGGAVFGPVLGTILNLTGATLGATAAFCLSRYIARKWIYRFNHYKIGQLIRVFDRRGWPFLAFLRVVPIIPFNLVNYGLGLTNMKLRDYVIITVLFLTPPEIIYTSCGYAGSHALLNGTVLNPVLIMGLLGLGVLFTLLVIWLQKNYRLSNW